MYFSIFRNAHKGLPTFRYVKHSRHKENCEKEGNTYGCITDIWIIPCADKKRMIKEDSCLFDISSQFISIKSDNLLLMLLMFAIFRFFFNLNSHIERSKCAFIFLANC